MLSINNLNVDIAGAPVIRSASLDVADNALFGLVGRNGAGKTSLLRSIMGLLAIRSGSIRLHDTDLLETPAHARARLGIGYMPEDRRIVPSMTVESNIILPAEVIRLAGTSERLKMIYDLIPELRAQRDRPAASLSGGQQKLVALARAFMIGDKLLLLDEPSEGVAPSLAKRINEILKNLRGTGVGILVSDSNEKHLVGVADRLFTIERGEIAEAGRA